VRGSRGVPLKAVAQTDDTDVNSEGSPNGNSGMPSPCALVLQPPDLLPGDVLLYRARKPNVIQRKISSATDSPYTHAAIYIGDDLIAESTIPFGVKKNALKRFLKGSQCVGVLRTQLGFGGDRPHKLSAFIEAVILRGRLYNVSGIATFESKSTEYFDSQLEFIRENYCKINPDEEFSEQCFFCSAFVVACYSVVGVIDETARAAYPPEFFAPGHLHKDSTFGWLLGYLVPEGGSIPEDDPLLLEAMPWQDGLDARWWG
jgi:hypothetical protein